MTVFATVQINEQSFQQAEAFLTRLPLELRNKVIPPAVKAAGAPVAKAAAAFAPSSQQTGSRAHWSRKVAAQRASAQPLKDTIKVSTVRKYKGGEVLSVYVGPEYQKGGGNLINIIGHPHNQPLWWSKSKGAPPASRIIIGLKANDFLQRATQSTESAQQSAFVAKIQSETDKLLAAGAKS